MAAKTDPRPWQLAALSALCAWGALALDLEVRPERIGLLLVSALATQWTCTRLCRAGRFDPRSAGISALSLALLLRTSDPLLAASGAVLAVASKFAIRVRGKHVFNPTCLAIVVLLALTDRVWVSAGQWGSAALAAFGIAGLGLAVLSRSSRADVTLAFLGFWSGLIWGRAAWLGDPWQVPLHALANGAVLLFGFFMISDPKTLPDRRAGRMIFAGAVALLAFLLQFGLYRTNGLLIALAIASPLVPLLDRWLPGERYAWRNASSPSPSPHPKELFMRPSLPLLTVLLALAVPAQDALAFCGFYVAKADARLFNRASQVVLARDGERTVITMSNDFRGEPNEFAMVVPVPTFIERGQIHVGDRALIEHLDAYTAPRLVEYFDADPCAVVPEARPEERWLMRGMASAPKSARARALGVRIEASYTVGEYDILILSAKQSAGLAQWLRESGYRLPDGADSVLGSYLRQGMHFFVARVNLGEQARLGFEQLRPLQVAYSSPRFMLPIRLGTLNADGAQELFVYTLTRRGRVETTNYRTTRLPSGSEIPAFVKGEFGDFYRAMFSEQVRRDDMRSVFLEYAWDMGSCDPCAAAPLSARELRGLGVFWQRAPGQRGTFVTRLHLRYDREHFPADLVLQETGDRRSFQGRYVIRHAFEGEGTCPAAGAYRSRVRERQEREAQTLATLTGWSLSELRRRQGLEPDVTREPDPWWRRLWTP
ncbi:MAG: DUF2330 domain-containing protein [Myxococcota bacterium]